MTSVALLAPSPGAVITARNGTQYVADSNSMIYVNPGLEALGDLVNAGCIPIPASGALITSATNNTVYMDASMFILEMALATPAYSYVYLPKNPVLWWPYTIKDGGNNCQTYPITVISQTGTFLNGTTELTMNTQNGMSLGIYNNGTNWRIK